MSALAWLDTDAARAHQWRRANLTAEELARALEQSIQARDAVAVLIAEAQAVLAHVEDEDAERVGNQCTLCHSYRARLRAALARCGGA